MSDQNQNIVVMTGSQPGPMNLSPLFQGVMRVLSRDEREQLFMLFTNPQLRNLNASLIREAQSYLSQMAGIEGFDATAFERIRASVVGVVTVAMAMNQLGHDYATTGTHPLLDPTPPTAAPVN